MSGVAEGEEGSGEPRFDRLTVLLVLRGVEGSEVEGGSRERTGCRIKSGMTGREHEVSHKLFRWQLRPWRAGKQGCGIV